MLDIGTTPDAGNLKGLPEQPDTPTVPGTTLLVETLNMNTSVFAPRASSLNAKVGAVTLVFGGFLTLLLSHFSEPLAPLRILSLVVMAFATWAFCDEMGIRKPLNRAAMVFLGLAIVTRCQILLGVATDDYGRYMLAYAALLLAAMLFFSIALLHRRRAPRLVGAAGLLVSALPIAALIVGHIIVGGGAFFGVQSLLAAADGNGTGDTSFVVLIERLFGLWAYFAAWLLWRGLVTSADDPAN